MMILASIVLGITAGALGYLIAPASVCPRPGAPLMAGIIGSLPGAVMGLSLADDWTADISSPSLALSVFAATLAVLAAAFLPERQRSTP
ncbi:MAG: hypothetical protein QM817_10595 [Archangium sp.]